MKNKKGFTLVELLAVIAILAILVIIALPNVMGMFNTAKENSFKTELKEIYKAAEQTWINDSMYNTNEQIYSRCENGCSNSLDLSGRSNLQYCIKFDNSGKIKEYYATDGTFQYSYNGGNLKIEDINDIEKISGSNISLTCEGIEDESKTLYYILQSEAENGKYAKEYTGEHKDSLNENGNKKIYHWYASNTTNANAILEKNNVLFANHCWQMIRTTDTGGVRLLYYGEASDNKCLATRPNHVGFNQSYVKQFNGNYYYATAFTYDANSNGFYLSGEKEQVTMNNNTGNSLVGKYTCMKNNPDELCSIVWYIESFRETYNANASYISLNGAKYDNIGITYYTNASGLNRIGYMYNTDFVPSSKGCNYKEIVSIENLSKNTYWVSDSYTYNSSTRKYKLDNPIQVNSATTYSMNKKYTFLSTNKDATGTVIKYVISNINNSYNYVNLTNNEAFENVNYDITYGTDYTLNQNGTYSLINPVTIKRLEWPSKYSEIKEKYVCLNTSDNTCSDLLYAGYTDGKMIYYLNPSNNYIFSNDVIYENGKYKLTGDKVSIWNILDDNNMDILSTHHYTCFDKNEECEEVSYVYGSYIYRFYNTYIKSLKLSNGDKIEGYLNKLLFNSDVNNKDSSIKSKIDSWFKNNMLNYVSYLEDSIYCNNRNVANLSGWNPNGGSIKNNMTFSKTGLVCSNITDRFSLSNSQAKLKYPVGLLSKEELDLLNNNTLRKTGSSYWTMTPQFYGESESIYYISSSYGSINSGSGNTMGISIRPAITLKKNTMYSSGNGSKENPYVVKTN